MKEAQQAAQSPGAMGNFQAPQAAPKSALIPAPATAPAPALIMAVTPTPAVAPVPTLASASPVQGPTIQPLANNRPPVIPPQAVKPEADTPVPDRRRNEPRRGGRSE